MHIGNVTVYYIVREWNNNYGVEKANVFRELPIKLKKHGLTVTDCVKGFRMSMIFKKYGIKEDEIEDRVTYF